MKWCSNLVFPVSGNLFKEGWRLFIVNYIWLVLLVMLLSTVTFADRVGKPDLKSVYQSFLGITLFVFCLAYCTYWYGFGFCLGQKLMGLPRIFKRGVFLGLGAVMLNLTLCVGIDYLGFSSTGDVNYNTKAELVQVLLLFSIVLMPLLCGLGALMGYEKAASTYKEYSNDA